MPFDVAPLLAPADCAVVVFECQEGVIGDGSALPGLAAAVREAAAVEHIAALLEEARRGRVPIVHAVLRRRPGDAGPPGTTPLEHRLRRQSGATVGGAIDMGPVVAPLSPREGEAVVERSRGLTGFHGTELEAVLRDLGARTIVLVGVSLNIGIPGTAIEAVNRGFTVVVPRDCVAADPAEYGEAALRYQLRQLAFLVDRAELSDAWSA